MSEPGKAVRDVIDVRRNVLAQAIVRRQWKLRPDLERRYGSEGHAKCLEDANFHLQYLAEAIAASEPKLFIDYVAWAKVMLASRNIPTEDLCSHLQVLRDVIVDDLPHDIGDTARDYVNAALETLPRYPLQVPTFLDDGSPHTELARSYLASLLRYERHVATKLILDAVESGIPIRDIYCFVFERCQREVGRLWQLNAATVAQEHYCTASAQLIMALLYPRMFADSKPTGGRVVAACVPGELHELGPRILCDLLEMEGWDTVYLGANLPLSSLLQTVKIRQPDVLAISATMTFHLSAVRKIVTAIRGEDIDPKLKIVVGGYSFRASSELWRGVGADGFARNALEAIDLLKRWQS